MIRLSVLQGLVAGIFFTLFMWAIDALIMKEEVSYQMLLMQGAIFALVMSVFYYFMNRRKNAHEE